MLWSNVKLIFQRETRDQLRDRRTLFTIAVMPLVLYPLMGMAMLQVAQFTREHPTRIWMVGEENLPDSPSLFVDGSLNPEWLGDENPELLHFVQPNDQDQVFYDLISKAHDEQSMPGDPELVNEMIDREMKGQIADLAVVFTPSKIPSDEDDDDGKSLGPSVYILHNSANERSTIASDRVGKILNRWRNAAVHNSLESHGVPLSVVQGIPINRADVSAKSKRQAATWSKILPFIVIVWSLTGAFYPAIDLCAGEKERGTFETLLSSPAGRNEIAIGKLLTVMSFSIVTSLLNLLSMAFTGLFVASQMGGAAGLGGLGLPPMSSLCWLVLALIPISALFSAVALAAAAFARSSKEGQYYLIPLMMISMPLMMVPMLPGARLDLGTSLIPVSGLMLLLKGLIEGQYAEVLPYIAPVCMVTFTCCYLAIRWVVKQFNSESVLFRASEKFAVGTWLQKVMRDRHELPSVGNACLLGVMILVLGFFIQLAVGSTMPESWFGLAKTVLIVLVATIGMPAILMAMFLTRNPRKSLRLNFCSLPAACAAVLMAMCFHPLITWFSGFVIYLYPLQGGAMAKSDFVNGLLEQAPGLWAILLLMAVAPAIIEELAFRGFILSGLQGLRNRWQAILFTSILFGLAHFAIQQAIITFVIGMILGVIAIHTRSLIPCILYHATHNAITVLLPRANASIVEGSPVLPWMLHSNDGTIWQYSILPGIAMTLVGVLLMVWFIRYSSPDSLIEEENGEPILQPALGNQQ